MICAIVLSLNRHITNCKNQLVALPFLDEDEFYKHAFDHKERAVLPLLLHTIIGSPASAPLPLPLPLPRPPTTTNQAAAVAPASVGTDHKAQPPTSAGSAPKPTNPQQRALQQQIQAQLQSQLQAIKCHSKTL